VTWAILGCYCRTRVRGMEEIARVQIPADLEENMSCRSTVIVCATQTNSITCFWHVIVSKTQSTMNDRIFVD
jgi:hypothetical protein